jgi:hypothetical protein
MTRKAQSFKTNPPADAAATDPLFTRVAAILDHAQAAVARTIKIEMVLAYWHIGREIVESIQGGEGRAEIEADQGGWSIRHLERQIHTCLFARLLNDLKMGRLTHQDVGQMDGYVRLFDDQCLMEGDNPTIGLILCAERNEAVAKYSVLSEGKQVFASKYLKVLPSEEDLRRELERERERFEVARLTIPGHEN